MAATRLYRVYDGEACASRLVEATSAAAAVRHVATKRYRVDVAKPKDIADMMSGGVKVERAGEAEASDE